MNDISLKTPYHDFQPYRPRRHRRLYRCSRRHGIIFRVGQVVIPKQFRDTLQLTPGSKVVFLVNEDEQRLLLVPVNAQAPHNGTIYTITTHGKLMFPTDLRRRWKLSAGSVIHFSLSKDQQSLLLTPKRDPLEANGSRK